MALSRQKAVPWNGGYITVHVSLLGVVTIDAVGGDYCFGEGLDSLWPLTSTLSVMRVLGLRVTNELYILNPQTLIPIPTYLEISGKHPPGNNPAKGLSA